MRVVPVSQKLSQAIADDDFQWRQIADLYCRGGRSAVGGLLFLGLPPRNLPVGTADLAGDAVPVTLITVWNFLSGRAFYTEAFFVLFLKNETAEIITPAVYQRTFCFEKGFF